MSNILTITTVTHVIILYIQLKFMTATTLKAENELKTWYEKQ